MIQVLKVSGGTESATKNGKFRLLLNPTFTNPVQWDEISNESATSQSFTLETYSDIGIQLASIAVIKNGGFSESLKELGIELELNDVISLAYISNGGTADVDGALTFAEER